MLLIVAQLTVSSGVWITTLRIWGFYKLRLLFPFWSRLPFWLRGLLSWVELNTSYQNKWSAFVWLLPVEGLTTKLNSQNKTHFMHSTKFSRRLNVITSQDYSSHWKVFSKMRNCNSRKWPQYQHTLTTNVCQNLTCTNCSSNHSLWTVHHSLVFPTNNEAAEFIYF